MAAAWIGWVIAKGDPFATWNPEIFMILLSTVFFVGASNILNDLTDVETDRISHPSRYLPDERLRRGDAITIMSCEFFFSYMLVTVVSFLLNNHLPISIFLIAIMIDIAYEWLLKKNGLIGNLIVSLSVGLPFLYGASLIGVNWIHIVIFLMASFSNVSREIVKDVQDMEGDLSTRDTLPNEIGEKRSLLVSGFFIITAVVLSFLPIIFGSDSAVYVIPVIFADIIFLYSLERSFTSPKKAQIMIKVGMVFALFAFFGLAF